MRKPGSLVLLALLASAAHADESRQPELLAACAGLSALVLDAASVTVAEPATGGRLINENPGPFGPSLLENLPSFCRVGGTATPVAGSHIGFEAWLPASGWNRRLLMLGNGGYSSAIPYMAFAEYLRQGYAVAATDTGHTGDDPVFARGRPEAIVDWGHRAVHVALGHVRSIATRYFDEDPAYRYFAGCSTGGHQALMSAQRYPGDFDGILVGAPGHNRTHLNAGFLWQFLANHRPGGGPETIVPANKLATIASAVLAQCRQNNGSRSGGLPTDAYLDDPLACEFDPEVLACAASADNDCLGPGQLAALAALYDGPRNPRSGERIYFGQTPGSEAAGGPPTLPGWSLYWADPRHPAQPARVSFWQFWVFDDPDWDWWAFDFDPGMRVADDRLAPVINAMDPDLGEFRRAGGKLLHYHGLNDPVVPAADSISYFRRADAEAGGAGDFYRLFLAPGVEHCRGGPGPDEFNALSALEAWVEEGAAPERIVATKYRDAEAQHYVEFSRPLCPYPEYAAFDGNGDPRLASSYACRDDRPRPDLPAIGADYIR